MGLSRRKLLAASLAVAAGGAPPAAALPSLEALAASLGMPTSFTAAEVASGMALLGVPSVSGVAARIVAAFNSTGDRSAGIGGRHPKNAPDRPEQELCVVDAPALAPVETKTSTAEHPRFTTTGEKKCKS